MKALCGLAFALIITIAVPNGAAGDEIEMNNPYSILNDSLPEKLSNAAIKPNSERYCYSEIEEYNRSKTNTNKVFTIYHIEYRIKNNSECFTDNFLELLNDKMETKKQNAVKTNSNLRNNTDDFLAKNALYLRCVYKLMADDTINEVDTERIKNHRESVDALLN